MSPEQDPLSPAQDALKRTDLPLEEIARRLHSRWSASDPKGATVEPRSLAIKLGNYRRGEGTAFFRKRPAAYQALCEVLEVPVAQRGLAHMQPDRSFPFSGFPDLPPVFAGEAPCPTSDDGGWLGTIAQEKLQRGHNTWIVAAPGCGKRLACFSVRHARPDVHVVQVRSLEELDLSTIRDDQHLLVRVEVPSPNQLDVHRALLNRFGAAVCVLASFEPPSLGRHGWELHHHALPPAWRHSFVTWALRRLPPVTKLNARALESWLEFVDPKQELFPTPGDLLGLIERAHRIGAPSEKTSPSQVALETLHRLFATSGDPYLQARGADLVQDMLRTRFLDAATSSAPRSSEGWATTGFLGRLFEADGHSPPTRRGGRREPSAMTRPADPHAVVEAMRLAGILRVERSSDLEFAPWVRVPLERNVVRQAIDGGDLRWLHWATDGSRAREVESALGSFQLWKLLAIYSSQLPKVPDGVSRAALVESTFVAVARALDRSSPAPTAKDTVQIQALGIEQLRLVRQLGEEGCHGPVVLPRASESARKEWFDLAWRFSFIVAPPKALDVDPGLIFPGWSRRLVPGHDAAVLNLLWSLEPPMRDLHRVLRQFADLEMPEVMPLDLLVAFVIDGDQRKRLRVEHWRLLFESDALETLCRRIDAVTSEREAAYRALLKGASTVFGHDMKTLVYRTSAALDGWRRYVPDDEWDEFLEDKDVGRIRQLLEWLAAVHPDQAPPGLVRRALRRLAEQAQVMVTPNARPELAELVYMLDESAMDILIALVVDHSGFGEPAAQRGWQLKPDLARDAAVEALRAGRNAASPWFHAAPMTQLSGLLAALESHGGYLPSWVDLWLRMRLPESCDLAPRVFDLLERTAQERRAATAAAAQNLVT